MCGKEFGKGTTVRDGRVVEAPKADILASEGDRASWPGRVVRGRVLADPE